MVWHGIPTTASGLNCVRTILGVVLTQIDSNEVPLTNERVVEIAGTILLLRADDCFERFHTWAGSERNESPRAIDSRYGRQTRLRMSMPGQVLGSVELLRRSGREDV